MEKTFWILFCFFLCLSSTIAEIKLEENGYTGIIVTIADHVKEDTNLLTKIQDWLTDSSRKLYTASKNFVFLKEITIRIPDHWENTGQYNRTIVSTTKIGDIYIENQRPGSLPNPFTYGLPGCGLKGRYIRFTTDLLMSGQSSNFGHLETIFMHEWGHFRWGLMDEYPTSKDTFGNIIRFYLYNGNWEPVRCTTEISGYTLNKDTGAVCSIDNSGRPEPDCYFFPVVTNGGSSSPVASIMGDAYIPSLSQFCDSKTTDKSIRHNEMAPNNQNDMCGGKSSWDIMRENEDFKGTSPGSPNQNTIPKFYLEQAVVQGRFCLLIDVSGSMSSFIIKARDVVATVISNVLPSGSFAGVVTFSSSATVRKEMTEILSETDRTELIASLPTSTDGSTSIGSGLQMCYQELLKLKDVRGAKIYLATDGQENKEPLIEEVLPEILKHKIIIDTLAIGDSADQKLRNLSSDTGGSSYFYTTSSPNSTALLDALVEPFKDATKDPSTMILSEHIKKTTAENVIEKIFYIDESIGRDTVVQFTSENLNNINMTVQGPDFSQSVIGSSSDVGVISIKMPGKAKSGEYSAVMSSGSADISGTVSILSKVATPGEAHLEASVLETPATFDFSPEIHIPLFVTINKGTSPVSKATVTAYIENQIGDTTVVELKDNAVGADSFANDGIYSAYILPEHIRTDGRHSIKVVVMGQNSSVFVPSAKAPGKNFEGEKLTEQEVEPFMRVAISNEITVTGYTPSYNAVDILPPAPIRTLVLADTTRDNVFTIIWLAVGDDFDNGKASAYDIRISTDFGELRTNLNNQSNIYNTIEPKEPGQEERFNFTIENIQSNTSYFIVVRAIDEAGNVGDISNIVTVSVLTDTSWIRQEPPTVVNKSVNGVSDIFIAGIATGSVLIAIMFFLWVGRLLMSRRLSIPRKTDNRV